ncbi:MAG: hypothetical protein HDT01_04035 [Bacteroidales bacterium]|nr:hypothetical protein [Bacteroidales bacterium]
MKLTLKNILGAALLLLTATACTNSGSKKGGTIVRSTSPNVGVMACDASFQNIMQQEIDIFEYTTPGYSILPFYIDEAACVDSLMNGRANVAVISRPLNSTETKALKTKGRAPHTTRIAVDAVALIVNKDNPMNEITMSELKDILDGKFKTWRDIQPSPLGEIRVVFDHQSSSTVRFMKDSLLDGRDLGADVYAQGSNPAVFETVKNNKNALGVIGVSWIATNMSGADMTAEERAKNLDNEDITDMGFSSDIKVLRVRRDDSLDSYQPYQAYILDGKYPLHRSMYMVNTGLQGTAAKSFYVFVTGWRGQKVILTTGVLPSTVTPRVVELN